MTDTIDCPIVEELLQWQKTGEPLDQEAFDSFLEMLREFQLLRELQLETGDEYVPTVRFETDYERSRYEPETYDFITGGKFVFYLDREPDVNGLTHTTTVRSSRGAKLSLDGRVLMTCFDSPYNPESDGWDWEYEELRPCWLQLKDLPRENLRLIQQMVKDLKVAVENEGKRTGLRRLSDMVKVEEEFVDDFRDDIESE